MEQTFITGALLGATMAMFFATILASRKIKQLREVNRELREQVRFQEGEIRYLQEPSYSCVHGPQKIEVPSQAAKSEPTYTQSNAVIDHSSCAGEPVDTGYQESPKNEKSFLGLW